MTELPVRQDDLVALAALLRSAADPYPACRRWRAERPVARPREGLFVFSRFADCEAVLGDPAFGKAEDGVPHRGGGPAGRQRGEGESEDRGASAASGADARSLLRLNPPDHTRLRRLVSRAFTPARVRALEPRIEAIARELLEAASGAADGRFDLIEGLALPLPVAVISELLGVEPPDRPRLVSWSAALARSLDPPFLISDEERGGMLGAYEEFAAYLRGLLPARRRDPGGDLISALVQASDEGGTLTEDEVVGLCMLLLIAGHETTRSLIGSAVLALLCHPAQLAALRAAPGTPDPDSFRLDREGRRHLSFGHGIHFCLGAPLARLEAAVALRLLLPALPGLRVAAQPEWKPNVVLRGLEHLILEPAPAVR